MNIQNNPVKADAEYRTTRHPSLCQWDAGPSKTPYCCSFHWFRLPDGRIVGLDVIRDRDQLGLRAYLVESDGSLKALCYTAPSAAWEPFMTERPLALGGPKPTIGRGENWISGSLQASEQPITRILFDLSLHFSSKGRSSSKFPGWNLVYLDVTDFPTVHTTGWMEIEGVRYTIDSEGPVSIHYGEQLPSYGYCVTVHDPRHRRGPKLLLSSITRDNLRVGQELIGTLLKETAFTYAYGAGGVPGLMHNIGKFERNSIRLNKGSIVLSVIQPFGHTLFEVETITATAQAVFHPIVGGERGAVRLGQVIIDYHGSFYTDTLTP